MATVQEIIDAAQQRTNDAVNQANDFVDRLYNLANRDYSWDVGSMPFVEVNQQYSIHTNAPTFHDAVIDDYEARQSRNWLDGSMPGSVADSDIQLENISDFNFQPVELQIPDRPEFVNPTPPTGDVQIDEVSVNLGERPEVYMDLQHDEPAIPEPDTIDFEQFMVPVPEVDYLTPTNQFDFVEQEYSSDFRDSIVAVLKDDIENGGTGINPDDEQALFERARDREAVTYRDSNQQIARQFAARGFKIPTGAMAGLMAKARDGFNAAMSGINRDIMLRRSDLHVQARQMAMQVGTTLDNAMLSYHGTVMERAMNAARLVAQFGIEYHNMEVRKFADRLQQWKTHSDVRSQWVDNLIKKTREYELKLQKLDLVDKRNSRRTELMNAMNRAVQIAEDIRRTELEIGKFQLENNRMRIEQSKLLTQNYAEIMRSNDAAARAYGEAIRAETLRNEPFRLRLEAHKEEVATARARIDMKDTQKAAETRVLGANMQRYEARLRQYGEELNHAIRKASEAGRLMGLDMEGWKTQLLADSKQAELNLDVQRANARQALDTYRTNLEGLRTDAGILTQTTDITRQASEAGINLYESLITGAQAALGTISVLTEEATAS